MLREIVLWAVGGTVLVLLVWALVTHLNSWVSKALLYLWATVSVPQQEP